MPRSGGLLDDLLLLSGLVKLHARDDKVDLTRIALIGESAGGHLVSYVGTKAKDDGRCHEGLLQGLLEELGTDGSQPLIADQAMSAALNAASVSFDQKTTGFEQWSPDFS